MANRKPDCNELFTVAGITCSSPEETFQLGKMLAAGFSKKTVLSLEGPLGAGKTQLTKGIVSGLGGTDEVSSPTYTLLHEYSGRLPVFHFDFYRMESAEDLTMAGYDDCLGAGVVILEWGDKYAELLPPGAIRLRFELLSESTRRILGEVVQS